MAFSPNCFPFEGTSPGTLRSGLFSSGASPHTRTGLVHKMASDHLLVVTPEALEETHRNVWLVLEAHGWEPAEELDMDIAQTLIVFAKMGVTDTRELLRLTLEHFELAPLN